MIQDGKPLYRQSSPRCALHTYVRTCRNHRHRSRFGNGERITGTMALLSSDMIREIRSVADAYSRQERERRAHAAESLADRQPVARPVPARPRGERA